MSHQIIFREHYGTSGPEIVYIKPPGQNVIVPLHSLHSQSVSRNLCGGLRNFFRVVFLPQGYPESVSQDYFSYQLWDTVQAFCSSLNGTLTTQAIMRGVGVGDKAATPLAAALTWVLKDGAGNIGRIIFAWWKGTSLDADCKKWRLCADILNDFAMFLELLLPYFMGYSTALLCAATVLKSIVGVAGGATRAALTQHQAIRDNMADVSAKDGSQETCVNLLASVAGIILLTSIEKTSFMWLMFAIFTFTHIYANYKAVKALTISTLNSARLNIAISAYLETGSSPGPDIVNQKESVILGRGLSAKNLCGHDIVIGEPVAACIVDNHWTVNQLEILHHLYQDRDYILVTSEKHRKINIFLQQGVSANSSEIVRAYFHAILLGIAMNIINNVPTKVFDATSQSDSSVLKRLEQILKDTSGTDHINAILASIQIDTAESKDFLTSIQSAGWASSGHHLGSNEWRFVWSPISKKETPQL